MRAADLLKFWLRSDDAVRGRIWQRRSATLSGAGAREQREFERRFRLTAGDEGVRLGRALGLDSRYGWYGIPYEEAVRLRAWITGTSGGGKTYEVVALLLQLLRRPMVLWVFDFKGELSDLLAHTVLPALAGRPEGAWLRGRVHLIDLFGAAPPALRLTEPEQGVPRHVQALTLSATLQEVLNADHGLRMERVFLMASSLAIEQRQPLTILGTWLSSPEVFAQAAARSSDPRIRAYAANTFPREPRASLQALSSRLDLLFFLPEIRRAFEAPSCVSFADLTHEGVFLFRVGGAPAGSEAVEAAIGSLLLGRATRAIMGRSVTESTLPLLVLLDEGQRAIRARDVSHLERVLTQARFKRSSIVFCNQDQSAQLDPDFARLLRANTSTEFIFRAGPEDAERLARHLPMRLPGKSEDEQRRAIAHQITHLPQRAFILWSKEHGQATQLRSPRIDLVALEREAAALPQAVREQLFAASAMPNMPTPDEADMPGAPFPPIAPIGSDDDLVGLG